MQRREVLHPARVVGFLLGLFAAAGCIGMGIDAHRSGQLQGRPASSFPGP